MGFFKKQDLEIKENQVNADAKRWIEIQKSTKLMAKEKEAIETRLRAHVLDSGEVLIGDLLQVYEKSNPPTLAAISEGKDEAVLLDKFLTHWKEDKLIGLQFIETKFSIAKLREAAEKYKQLAVSLKKHGLQIVEGAKNIHFKQA